MELPKIVEQVFSLDAKNHNTLWAKSLSKELENVRAKFEIVPDGKKESIGYKFV